VNNINAFVAAACLVISFACLLVTAAQGNGIFTALFGMTLMQAARDLCNELTEP